MTNTKSAIKAHKLSKLYRLGTIGPHTFRESVNRFCQKLFKKETLLIPYHSQSRHHCSHPSRAGHLPNSLWAIKDVSFTIPQGQITGIIGENGSGKSTLLKILSRITTPTSGKALLRGRASSLLEIGTGFHSELSGRENIYLNGTLLGMRRQEIDRKFDAIVDFSGIESFIDTPVKRYSWGMYLRLAFSVAAHLETEIILVDEILGVGDAAFQKKCFEKMRELANENRTIVFASHDMESLSQLCTHGIWMHQGKLESYGDIQTLIHKYLEKNSSQAHDPLPA